MFEIKDIIARFSLKISLERKVNLALKDYFKEKNIPYTGVVPKISQQTVFIHGDSYTKMYIQTYQKELLALIQKVLPESNIQTIK